MSFDSQWLTDDLQPPEHLEHVVNGCRQFLDTPESSSDAATLRDFPADALIALVTILVDRDEGAKLNQLNAVKSIRKVIGKTLHQLRSKGKRWTDTAGHVATIKHTQEELASYMSIPHPSGARFLILTGQHSTGAMAAVYALGHETNGLANFSDIPNVSRSKLANLVDEIARLQNLKSSEFLVRADPNLVRLRFREAVDVHRRLGKEFPADYHPFSGLLKQSIPKDEHPIDALIPTVDPALVRDGIDLFGHTDTSREPHRYRIGPADRPIMDPQWTRETGQRLRNAMDSPVVINDHQRKERVLVELDHIIEETFDVDFRLRMANRLLDAAYVLHVQQNTRLSQIALATANALRDQNQSVLDIPWAHQAFTGLFDADAFVTAISPTMMDDIAPDKESDTGSMGFGKKPI